MQAIYRPRFFRLEELVPPEVFERGEAAWELLDPRALRTLDLLRERFGSVVVNDWKTGGTYRDSGFRAASSTVGPALSQHRFGRAFDCKFRTTTPAAVHAHLLEHPADFPEITTLEAAAATPTWLHFDVRNNAEPGIRVVNP